VLWGGARSDEAECGESGGEGCLNAAGCGIKNECRSAEIAVIALKWGLYCFRWLLMNL
jgi:hypothetical protein